MSTMRPVQFANFVCRFGHFEMLDLSEEIVIPAFLENLTRTYHETKYFLHGVEILNLGRTASDLEPAICGRIVKDTVLRSQQVFSDGELVRANGRMESSPTAVFILLLKSHKLIYFSEFPGAPSLDVFRSTILQFIKRKRVDYINSAFAAAKLIPVETAIDAHLTKVELNEQFPLPTLEVLPLTNEENLDQFIKRFKTLQRVTIRMIKPNNEVNPNKFFDDVRTASENVGADHTNLVFANSEGLTKTKTTRQIHGALDGNAVVSLSGIAENGSKLSGTNEDFKVSAFLAAVPGKITGTAVNLMNLFREYVSNGMINMAAENAGPQDAQKLQRIVDLNNPDEAN